MDVRNWNKVLLQWITKCNFVENNFFNVEQTNIDLFYQKICAHHKEACKFSTLQSLLQTHYPSFAPHLDDENALSAAEYMYVYSLLLHFCCVKCPEEYFQIICQKLSEQTQQSIHIFFEHIIAYPNINKEIIRQVIAEVNNAASAVQQQKSETISSSLASSSNGGANSTDLQTSFSTSCTRFNGDSPVGTPNRKTISAMQRISPDTPKSSLLEERTRELYNFKALLETERYEKSLLELQITQYDKQIETMVQERKNLQQTIQELKDELLNKSIDPCVPDHEEDEKFDALRCEFRKKIREKEHEAIRLFDTINTLREEKSLLEGKLRLADEKLTKSREYITDLELKVDELETDIRKKDTTIKTLTEDKADLEHFIAETRSAASSSRPNFDSSVDCLDASFSRYTNSSGSLGSPENLGASVVDVQLREKEQENNQLRQELNELRTRHTELATLIQSKTKHYMQEYNFETNNNGDEIKGDHVKSSNSGNNEAIDLFNVYADCMNHLSKSFKDAKNQIQQLEQTISEINSSNNQLNAHIEEFESEVTSLREQAKVLGTKNKDHLNEIEELQELKQKLAKNYENSVNNYEARLKEGENQKLVLEKTLEEVKSLAQNTEAECNRLHEKCEQQNAKLQTHIQAERLVKSKYEKLLIENNELRSKMRESDEHLETVRKNIKDKECELAKFGKEIVQLGCANVDLEEKLNKLTQHDKHVRASHEADIKTLNTELTDLRKAYEKLQKIHDSLTREREVVVENVEVLCQLHELTLSDVQDLTATLAAIKEATQKLLYEQQALQMEKLTILKQHDQEIQALNDNLWKGQHEIKTFQLTIESLMKEFELSQKTIDEMSAELQNLQAQSVSLRENHQAAQTSWSAKQTQLEAELKGEKEVSATKKNEVQSLEQQLKALEAALQAKQQEKAQQDMELELKEEQFKVFEASLVAAQVDKHQFEEQIDILKSQHTELEAQLKKAHTAWSTKQAALEAELKGEKEVRVAMEKEIETAEQQLNELKETLQAKQHEKEQQDKEVAIKQEQLMTYETTLQAALLEKTELEKQTDSLSKRQTELEAQLKEAQAAWLTKQEEWKAELKAEKDLSAAKAKKIETIAQRLQALELEIENQTEEMSKLQNELRVQLNELEQLKEANEALHTQKAALKTTLETQISGLKNENECLKTKLSKECDLNENKTLQLEKLKLELTDLQAKRDKLQQDFQAQEKELKQAIEVEKQIHAESVEKLRQQEALQAKLQTELDEKVKKLEKKYKGDQKLAEENLLKAEKALNQVSQQLQVATESLAARSEELKKSQQLLNEVHEKLANKTEMLESLQATWTREKSALEQSIAKSMEQIKDLEAARDEQKQRNVKLTAEQAFYVAENGNLTHKLKKIEIELTEAKEMFEAKIADLMTAKADMLTQLNEDLNRKEARINELKALIHETEKCLIAINDDSAKLKSELEDKETEILALNEDFSNTKTKVEQVKMLESQLNDIATTIENCYSSGDKLPKILAANETMLQPALKTLKAALHRMVEAYETTQLRRLKENQTVINEMQLKLEAQFQTERKLNAELANSKAELRNLEAVNEKVSTENETLQLKLSNTETDLKTTQNQFGALRSLNERLTERIDELDQRYADEVESLKAVQQTLNDQLAAQKFAYNALQKQNDEMQTEATESETAAEQRLEELKNELSQLNIEKEALEKELALKLKENESLAENVHDLELKNADEEAQIAQLKKKNILLTVEFSNLGEKHQQLYDEIQCVTTELEAVNTERTKSTELLNETRERNQKLERDLQTAQTQLKVLNDELEAAMAQQKTCVIEKQTICEQLNERERSSHSLGKEVNDLKQKLALSDLAKDDLKREIELLRTQVEVNSRYQTTSESKLKNIIETSQALERNLLSSENELKTMRAKLEQTKANAEKLEAENQKLRENVENLNKRIEKFAIKLGDAQAMSTKLERENEKLNKQLQQQQLQLETLQRDKNVLQNENKTLMERVNKSERAQEQMATRLKAAEKTNATLVAAKKVLETTEVDLKAKLKKLESLRATHDERLRKITHDYETSEREVVRLNLEIGALNTEIHTLKKEAKAEEQIRSRTEDLVKQLHEACTRASQYEQRNSKLENEQRELRNQLETVTDKLSKLTLTLDISNTKKCELNMVVEQLETKLQTLQTDRDNFEKSQKALMERLKEAQDFTEQLLKDKRALEEQLASANSEKLNKNTELTALRLELDNVRLNSVESAAAVNDKTSALVVEMDSLKARLKVTEDLLAKENNNSQQLRLDNQILQAKYRESKHRIEAEGSTAEERIKQNRLELEGKLEKMKHKMKALYTEEVTKMKTKQERETASLRAELSALKAQNFKYEEHTRKLSAELVSLNDRMLEYQKENTQLLTKLEYIQEEESQKFKRPNTATSSTLSVQRSSCTQQITSNIGSDFAMEDEEGEVFNNTYLTDLKSGRMTHDICPEELMRRNSQLPPHLKSSYAPQYDHGLCEDEVKDGQSHGLDDSMSALITSNTSCSRKKISGVTNYRKPGPPTPSKNGGRLSFGGSSEPTREILKESYDDCGNNALNKTPARFGFFSSRFSMGSSNHTRDEQQQQMQKQEQSAMQTPKCNEQDLRRAIHRRKLGVPNEQGVEHMSSVTKILTSTPRPNKHRAFICDKRRLINEMQNSKTASTPTQYEPSDITPPELSAIATPTPAKHFKRRLSAGILKRSKSRSSIGVKVTELQRRLRRPRERKERPSICVQKNIYASKSGTPQRTAQRNLNRFLGRKDRRKNFDRQRGLLNISSDENDNEANGKSTLETSPEDATYNVSKAASFEYVSDEFSEENESTEMVACGVQAIDGATYNVTTNDQFKTRTVNHSKSLDEKTYVDGETVAETTKTCASTHTISEELSAFDDEIEELQSDIFPDMLTSSERFEQLIKETECQAPFKVDSLRLSEGLALKAQATSASTISQSSASNNSGNVISSSENSTTNERSKTQSSSLALMPHLNTPLGSQNSERVFECVTPTPHRSTATSNQSSVAGAHPSSLLHHSRTIYGASVIFNRRIPNVDAVQVVRKSSIYFKNPKCSTFRTSCNLSSIDSLGNAQASGLSQSGDLILVTNQTITIFDLICMWQQMNLSTRLVVGSILIGCLLTVLTLLHSICGFV